MGLVRLCSLTGLRRRGSILVSDAINPSHYTDRGIEHIDAMRAAFGDQAVETFCKLNAFKYLWRSERKNGVEDLQKASWYLRMATGDDPRHDAIPTLDSVAKSAEFRRLELFEACVRAGHKAVATEADEQVERAITKTAHQELP